ncbi:MAG: O-antigen ligase family protein [Candidatus Moraniibacteriota bacterium]|nr:MAG: O-antigen ligase family protein [Candidatus Moranbacteria bacterium]
MTRFFFLFFFATLPFQFALSPMPGIDLHISRLFVIGLSGLWFIHSLIRRSLPLPSRLEAFLLLSVFFLLAFSLFFVENLSWGLRKLSFLLSFFPIFFVAFSVFREAKSREIFARVLVYGSVISGIVGIAQFFLPFIIGLDPAILFWQSTILPLFSGHTFSDVVSEYSSMVVNVGGTNFLRASAFFPDPHIASFFWGMTIPLSLMLAFCTTQPKTRITFSVASFIILLADILTFSRGGYLALLITALFALGILFSELIHKHILAFSISGLLLVLIAATPNPLSSRLISTFDLSDHSTSGRIAIWSEAIHIIEQHPFVGVGLGNYSNTVLPSATYREPRYAHNTLLDIAAETGILSAILFFLLLSITLTRSLTKYRNNPLIFAGGCALLIFSLHSLFETPLYSVHILPLFLSLIAFVL